MLGDDLDGETQLALDTAFELNLVHIGRVDVGGLRMQPLDQLREELRLKVVQGHLRAHHVDLFGGNHEEVPRRTLLDLGR